MKALVVARRRSLPLVAVLAAMTVVVGVPLTPAEAVNTKVSRACKGDYKRLCPRYKVGTSRLRACMEAKQDDISWRCIDALLDSGEVDRSRSRRRR